MVDYRRSAHAVTDLKYHVIWVTKYRYKILVVNDGSVDKTVEVAKKGGATVFSHSRNLGLAQGFKTEMEQCLKMGADIIVHTDADGQYPAKHIPELLAKLDEGFDLDKVIVDALTKVTE